MYNSQYGKIFLQTFKNINSNLEKLNQPKNDKIKFTINAFLQAQSFKLNKDKPTQSVLLIALILRLGFFLAQYLMKEVQKKDKKKDLISIERVNTVFGMCFQYILDEKFPYTQLQKTPLLYQFKHYLFFLTKFFHDVISQTLRFLKEQQLDKKVNMFIPNYDQSYYDLFFQIIDLQPLRPYRITNFTQTTNFQKKTMYSFNRQSRLGIYFVHQKQGGSFNPNARIKFERQFLSCTSVNTFNQVFVSDIIIGDRQIDIIFSAYERRQIELLLIEYFEIFKNLRINSIQKILDLNNNIINHIQQTQNKIQKELEINNEKFVQVGQDLGKISQQLNSHRLYRDQLKKTDDLREKQIKKISQVTDDLKNQINLIKQQIQKQLNDSKLTANENKEIINQIRADFQQKISQIFKNIKHQMELIENTNKIFEKNQSKYYELQVNIKQIKNQMNQNQVNETKQIESRLSKIEVQYKQNIQQSSELLNKFESQILSIRQQLKNDISKLNQQLNFQVSSIISSTLKQNVQQKITSLSDYIKNLQQKYLLLVNKRNDELKHIIDAKINSFVSEFEKLEKINSRIEDQISKLSKNFEQHKIFINNYLKNESNKHLNYLKQQKSQLNQSISKRFHKLSNKYNQQSRALGQKIKIIKKETLKQKIEHQKLIRQVNRQVLKNKNLIQKVSLNLNDFITVNKVQSDPKLRYNAMVEPKLRQIYINAKKRLQLNQQIIDNQL